MDTNKQPEGKHLTEKGSYKTHANSRRWHFLLVGEHGQIKSVKKFRGLAITAIGVVVVAVIGIAGLGFLYVRAVAHNTGLNHRIAAMKQQVAATQAEKEILMARLVIAETKIAGDPQATTASSVEPDAAPETAHAPTVAIPAVKSKRDTAVVPSASKSAGPPGIDPSSSPAETGIAVAVEDFKATLDTYQNILTLEYKVRNTKTDGTQVAGRTVLILKNSELDINTWVVLPEVKLVDGRPTGEKGQPFRISRFRVAKFAVEGYAEPSQFDKASVFVYTKTGELVLEKEFTVQIKVI